MKKIVRILVGLGCIFFAAQSAVFAFSRLLPMAKIESKGAAIVAEQPVEEYLPAFEKLTYRVKWMGMPAGIITASIKGITKIRGRNAYVLEVRARTTGFCSTVYKIDDRYVSYLDMEHRYTVRHEVYRKEGRYRKQAVTDFDQVNHKAYFSNAIDKTHKTFDIPPGVQDTLSACYYFMLLPFKVGDHFKYYVCNNEVNYELYGLIERSTVVSVPAMKRKKAFYMQPYAKANGEHVRKGRASGYFSDDERKLPLMAIIKAPVFSAVTIFLTKIDHDRDIVMKE